MTFVEWLIELLRDERGAASVKPVIVLMGGFCLCGSLLFDYDPNERLIEAVMVITLGGLGSDTWDKFSTKRATPAPSVPEDLNAIHNEQNLKDEPEV